MNPREILHLTIPAYEVAVARVVNASLRGRPVAIAPGMTERTQIYCLSSEAVQEGVIAGMALRQAKRLCPALIVLPPDPNLVSRANRALQKTVDNYSPVVEPASNGKLFLDLTGCQRLLGPGRDIAMKLEKDIETNLRLTGTLGVAGNKLVSKIAAGVLERPGVCDVLRGAERDFIAPMPISVLPGIGHVREQLLIKELNLKLIQELATLSIMQLKLIFGAFAPLIHQRARGEDFSPVTPPKRRPEVSAEGFLPQAENDDTQIMAELCRLTENCGLQLRKLQRGAAELTLIIHYADGVKNTRTQNLPSPQNHDLQLYHAAAEIFDRLCTRRIRIKGMKLTCRQLGWPDQQVDLFTTSGPTLPQQALQQTLDRLRSKYGMQVVRRGHTLAV